MLPKGNRILNSKEKKILRKALKEQFSIDELPKGVYIQNAKDKVFYINQDLERINIDEIYIDAIGMYMGTWQIDGFRLSIEGAQYFSKKAKHCFYELDKEQFKNWLKGADLTIPKEENSKFVIVTHNKRVLSCGRIKTFQEKKKEGKKESVLLNYTPKARRLIVINN